MTKWLRFIPLVVLFGCQTVDSTLEDGPEVFYKKYETKAGFEVHVVLARRIDPDPRYQYDISVCSVSHRTDDWMAGYFLNLKDDETSSLAVQVNAIVEEGPYYRTDVQLGAALITKLELEVMFVFPSEYGGNETETYFIDSLDVMSNGQRMTASDGRPDPGYLLYCKDIVAGGEAGKFLTWRERVRTRP